MNPKFLYIKNVNFLIDILTKNCSKIGLSTAVVEVISSSPGIVSSILSLGSELQLTFDVNIQGPQDCEAIFDADSMALIGGNHNNKKTF